MIWLLDAQPLRVFTSLDTPITAPSCRGLAEPMITMSGGRIYYPCLIVAVNCLLSCAPQSGSHGTTTRPVVRQIGEPSPTALKIVEFAYLNVGKTVGDGECWDFVNSAYRYAGIRYHHGYKWGRRVNWQTEGVRPGDVIQFSNARYPYAYTDENHTSIILKVANRSSVKVAHQHWNGSDRVSTSYIPLPYLRRGTQIVYRYEP